MTARNFVERFNASAATTLTTAIVSNTNAARLTYLGSLRISSLDWQLAHAIGNARRLINENRGRRAGCDRGAEANALIDTAGALGEWLVFSAIDSARGFELDVAALVASKAAHGEVDAKINGARYDVKTVSEGREYCTINTKQHLEKNAAAYVVVKLIREDVADLFIVSGEAVTGWYDRNPPSVPGRERSPYKSQKLPTPRFDPLPPLDATEAEAATTGEGN